MSPSATGIDDLPASLPVFPLSGALLLPRGHLPLNIFEPRYLNMTVDAMAEKRLIGMVQPVDPEEVPVTPDGRIKNLNDERLPLYRTGCAGKIVAFEETPDGRYLITLEGICRFVLGEEIETTRGYRRFQVDWAGFEDDVEAPSGTGIDRDRLVEAFRAYFTARNISADWDAIGRSEDERLVTSLAMACPFTAAEKQALLEAADLPARGEMLTTIAEMAAHGAGSDGHQPQ